MIYSDGLCFRLQFRAINKLEETQIGGKGLQARREAEEAEFEQVLAENDRFNKEMMEKRFFKQNY